MRIGVVANMTKEGVREASARLAEWADENGVGLFTLESIAPSDEERRELSSCDLVVTLGGDGTLLGAARMLSDCETPILGANLGKFGFLTELRIGRLRETLEMVRRNEHTVESRMNLLVRVDSGGKELGRFTALNDAVVHRAGATRIGHFETYVGGARVNAYTADGLILSTPTGSTAYNLSAGGPLVTPTMNAILITPICPHTLGIRPLVLPKDEEIQIRFPDENEELRLTVDGQESLPLSPHTVVKVSMSPHRTRLIRTGGPGFYDVLREKLHWGSRE